MPKKNRQRPAGRKKAVTKKKTVKVKAVRKKAAPKPAAKKRAVKKPVKKPAVKKAAVRKKAAPKPADLSWREVLPGEVFVGIAEDYLSHLSVMLITVKVPVAVGDTLHVRGFTSDFKQKVESIQLEHQNVNEAMAGQDVGIKIGDKVRKHDYIYKVTNP
jgi:hypothetical protein